MLDLTAISSLVTTLSVVIGVIFALMELRHLTETRKTEIIMNLYERFTSKEIVEAMSKVLTAGKFESLEDYGKKYGLTEALMIANLYEGLGVLLEQNLIDIKMVAGLFGGAAGLFSLWKKMEPMIHALREFMHSPFFLSHFEYLVKRLSEYKKEAPKV
jgi:hypothetical protein